MFYETFFEHSSDRAAEDGNGTLPDGPPPDQDTAYVSPSLTDLGHVRDVTLGSSPNGNADANAQYYW
ncbi:lasso RiPP family leader peptide-containing protein [Streptomyces sp. NPDC013455]|uniref:lasso RiPP family leader peptide-containing protein n=1 Tax=Streptomyces sp. NPDC013455 TaxID=3155605 RepID=UPI0033DC7A39